MEESTPELLQAVNITLARFNLDLYAITKSQQNSRENRSVAMGMITLEGAIDTCMGFNTFHMTETQYIRILHKQNASVWWLCK